MRTRQDIIDAIRQTAKENDGKPLGVGRFIKETGMTNWGKYWARFGDAQKEAGFITYREITVERNSGPKLPSNTAFYRLGTKERLAKKIAEYCKDRDGYSDILSLCKSVAEKSDEKEIIDDSYATIGEVYLAKSGRYYKIGKTNNTVRRGSELRIQLPEKIDLIHSIKTDDPSGIEAYWHKRFETKRMQGEWFDLSSVEVKAFKRWKRI